MVQDAHKHKSSRKYNIPDNLEPEARNALKELINLYQDKNIVIRPFDKGVGFFLIYKQDYIDRTILLLSDTTTYEVVEQVDAANKTIAEITEWANKFKKEKGMTNKIIEWVIPDINKQKPGNIYLNFKAHKPPEFPGRLITTGCNSYIENLSAITAFELKKVDIPYNLIDTPHFLRKIDELNKTSKLVGKNIIHVSVDIENMFPNIPVEFGIQECNKHLDKRVNPIFSTECISNAIEITLTNNIATFNNVTYRQKKGTAMGPKNACDYADVAMNYIDQAVHGNNPLCEGPRIIPIFWGRFRDDIYMPWVESLEELSLFENWINSIHPSLKFTFKRSIEGVEFLDLFVYTSNNRIHTKMYSKQSDTHSYLVPNSCHKYHIIKNIPFNIARRILQNNSETCNYEIDKEIYKKYLLDRGYNEDLIHESFTKVENMDRKMLYTKKGNNSKHGCVPLVINNNPELPPMSKIINKHKYLLGLDNRLKSILPMENIFVSYRSPKNIKDLLISSKLKNCNTLQQNAAANTGCYKCKKCYLCKWYLRETKSFTSFHTNQVFQIKSNITCSSKNIIYLIDCETHERSYVGYTTNDMKTRFSGNKSHLKNKRCTCEIVTHLIKENHNLDFSSYILFDETLSKNIKVTLIERVNGIEERDEKAVVEEKCARRELYWQRQLKTFQIYGGLNKRDGKKYYVS